MNGLLAIRPALPGEEARAGFPETLPEAASSRLNGRR